MYKALTALILSVSFPAFAETAISHIVVNQRWPWSEKVDVDFVTDSKIFLHKGLKEGDVVAISRLGHLSDGCEVVVR